MEKISGWGKYPRIEATVRTPTDEPHAKAILATEKSLIARGLGRSYGDSSLNKTILSSLLMNRIVSFNSKTGLIECEAGVSLAELLDLFVPQGWFLPTTPGTKFVTIGGAIASDVHGKNHHVAGSFGNHVLSCDVLLSDGRVVRCSKKSNTELFRATVGGMGLTGVILRASFKMKRIESAYITQKSVKARNIDEAFTLFESLKHFPLSMAWIDCLSGGKKLGRSILMVGDHAQADQCLARGIKEPLNLKAALKLNVPIDFPGFALNSLSVRAFNMLYYAKQIRKETESIVSYDPFFYPLDGIHNWNRIYGKRGFTQYQFVLPEEASREGLVEILKRISKSGNGSFLAVLKQFGKGNDNYISFPMEGYTLALDFAIKRGLFPFLSELDRMVLDYGGRIYLTKDVRMNGDTFRRGYPRAKEFIRTVKKYNKNHRFASLQSKRLEI